MTSANIICDNCLYVMSFPTSLLPPVTARTVAQGLMCGKCGNVIIFSAFLYDSVSDCSNVPNRWNIVYKKKSDENCTR